MKILPIATKRLSKGDDLVAAILSANVLESGDVLVVSSKVVTHTETGATDLASLAPTEEALTISNACKQDPRFSEFVLRETKRLGGTVEYLSPYAALTGLKPEGMQTGRILCPNAGADLSNTEKGTAIGWPHDAAASVKRIRSELGSRGIDVAVILSDSCCHPGRLGVTAFAMTVSGLEPVKNERGLPDLFGSPLLITNEAIADQLATAANALMGNAAQSVPAAAIRDHGIPFSDFSGWVPGIEPEDDLFRKC